MNFARLLFDSSLRHTGRVAIRSVNGDVTFDALAMRAHAVAAVLLEAGVGPGDRVAILLPHDAWAAAAFFGALTIGAIGVNVGWLHRPRQVEYILQNSGAHVLITSHAWRSFQARDLRIATPVRYVESLELGQVASPRDVSGGETAQIIYTSGSTGTPKGVMLTHDNLWAGVGPVVRYLGIQSDDRIADPLPFSFVYGFSQLSCALATGARLDIVDATIASEMVQAIRRNASTVLATVPPVWLQLLRVPGFRDLPSLRVLTCAGGRLPPDSVRALRQAHPHAQLYLMYGFTEVFRSTWLAPELVDAHPDSIGRPIEGAVISIVRPDGSPCDTDEAGELIHAGPTVAQGYWNDPAATAATFIPADGGLEHPSGSMPAARSGDLVKRDADGLLYFVGRRDHMIKTLGMRVSPDEVIDVLLASGLVVEVAVTAEPDALRGQRIVAHVVLAASQSLDALKRFAGTELPRYLQPARWVVRDALPRNASGKHDLEALWRGEA